MTLSSIYVKLLLACFLSGFVSSYNTHRGRKKSTEDSTASLLERFRNASKSFTPQRRDKVILFFGRYGSGKSRLVDFIANDTVYSQDSLRSSDEKNVERIPRMVQDESTLDIIYDYPEFFNYEPYPFSDIENFYHKTILKSAKEIKAIFCFPHFEIESVYKRNFMDFLYQINTLIPDVGEIEDSFGLVITRHSKTYIYRESSYDYLPTVDYLIQEVGKKLNDFYTELRDAPWFESQFKDRIMYEKAVSLLKSILEKKGGRYVKINVIGNSFDDEMLAKDHLKMFVSRINFSETNEEALDSIPENIVMGVSEEINRSVHLAVESLSEQIIGMVKFDGSQFDMTADKVKFYGIGTMFSKLKEKNIPNLERMVQEIIVIIKKLRFSNTENKVMTILQNKEVLNILQNSNGKSLGNIDLWLSGFKKLEEHLEEGREWCVFLEALHSHLLEPVLDNKASIQRILQDAYSRKQNYNSTIRLYDLSLHKVVKILTKDFTLDDEMYKSLIKTISLFDGEIIVRNPEDDKLEIKGFIVRASQIKKHYTKKKIKTIEIFAYRCFVMDEPLNFTGEEVSLAIVAPQWYLIGDKKIILSGKDAHSLEDPAISGEPGKPGKPGGPGGHFLSYAEAMLGSGSLHVISNGGKGGQGQKGGKGAAAKPGLEPNMKDEDNLSLFLTLNRQFRTVGSTLSFTDSNGTMFEAKYLRSINLYSQHEYWVKPQKGEKGQKGKEGGQGGYGGIRGTIQIIDGSGTKKWKETKNNGSTGESGRGGDGGDGANSYGSKVACKRNHCYEMERKPHIWLSKGGKGADGKNSENKKEPKEPRYYKKHVAINNYKGIIREWVPQTINEVELREGLLLLENNQDITKLYNHIALIEDLIIIEEQFHSLHKEINMVPFYESLHSRTVAFSKNIKGGRDEQLAVSHLLASILSKLSILKNDMNRFMIIDVHHFLGRLVQDIKILDKIGQNIMIGSYVEEFTSDIHEEIKSSQEIINNNFIPNLKKITNGFMGLMDKLMKELINLKEEGERKQRDLDHHQKLLRENMIASTVMSCLEGFSALVSLFNPAIGLGLAAATQVGSMITETALTPNNQYEKYAKEFVSSISEKVRKDPSGLRNLLIERQRAFYTKLEDIENEIRDLEEPNELAVISKKISTFKSILREAFEKNEPIEHGRMISLKNDLLQAMEVELKGFENDKREKRSLFSGAKAVIKTSIEIVKAVDSTYSHYRSKKEEMDGVLGLQKDLAAELERLRQFQEAVESLLIPLIKDLEQEIFETVNDLSGKTPAKIILSKSEMEMNLGKAEFSITEILSDFEVGKEIKNSFKMLKELMDNIFAIYDRMTANRDQIKAAKYLADLSSSRNVWDIRDQSLFVKIERLKFVVKTSGLLVQHERAIHALKQYVFPFADYFLDEFESLPSIEMGNNFENILFTIIPQIEKLYSSLDDWMTSINHHDTFIFQNVYFTDEYHQPFYVFDSSTYDEDIKLLFEGRTILVFADIKDNTTIINKNAVKFNEIGINFKIRDKRKEKELSDILDGFDVELTHYGNNHYKCADKYFVIRSEKQLFHYSIKKNDDGIPLRRNLVYDKIARSGYFLSPYAFWTIRLVNITNNFTDLSKFITDEIDIQLEGRGQYIEDSSMLVNICQERAKKYYKEFEPTAELDAIYVSQNSFLY